MATTMPDGSPQLTQTWADTDGEHVLVNTVEGYQKARDVARDPRVALTVSDPADPSRHHAVQGEVVAATTQGAAEHIDVLVQRYLGTPSPGYGGRDQMRLLLTVRARSLHVTG